MADITIDQVVAKDLHLEDLTTIDLQGSGVWDKMLRNMRVQLNDQFEKNRITGPTYGQVYAATYESTLQAAITLLLAKERQALEIKQLELQNQLTQAQIDQINDQMQKTPYEIEQIKAQTENIKTETAQTQYNIDHILPLQAAGLELENQTREYNLNTVLPTQVAQTEAQTAGVVKETELKEYQVQFLYPAQLEQANKQIELTEAQVAVQNKQLDLLQEQVSQAKAQTEYYAQKVITEKAQTDATVIGDGSVIDVQVELMNAQKDGYKRNAEQQAAQIMSNTWNVRRQTDEDTSANSTNLLDDATVGKTIQTLLSGVGVIVNPT